MSRTTSPLALAILALVVAATGCMRHRPAGRTDKTSKTAKTAAGDSTESVQLPPLPGGNTGADKSGDQKVTPLSTPTDEPLVPVERPHTPIEQPPLATVGDDGWISAAKPLPIPEPRPEVAPPEPSADSVWIAGRWERQVDHWQWVGGHWTSVPFLGAFWHNGYWKQDRGRHVWQPGHWGAASQGLVTSKPIPPPPLPTESIPPPPNPEYRWVPGHWDWQGLWIYIPGHFTLAPHPKAKWVPGQWTKGLLGNWRWISGHWEL